MYFDTNSEYWVIDVEGDLIPSTVIFCVCAVNVETQEEVTLTTAESIKEWFSERIKNRAVLIGHNIIGYDAPTLNRLLNLGIPSSRIIDTLVLSMVYDPSLKGGHSLESWGQRLRYQKGDFNDFTKLSEEMVEYCLQDARLTRKVFLALQQRLRSAGFTYDSLDIEHKSWMLIRLQKTNGFWFNIEEAHALYSKLRQIENDIRDQIYEYWPPELVAVAEYKRPFKNDGTRTKTFEHHCERYEKVEIIDGGRGYRVYDRVPFNIGSPAQRVEKLLQLGWEPREFTKITDKGGGGNPKVTDGGELVPSLLEFIEQSGNEQVKLIARWIDINARANMVNTWINSFNHDTHRIHGSLWLANTFRYRHSEPNTANIPAVRMGEGPDGKEHPLLGLEGAFTYEARALWGVGSDDRVLVGVDAKGIQLRVLAHYLNNPKFTEAILSADPHSANRDAWGFPEGKQGRSLAKTIVYATLMGAGDARVMSEAKLGSLAEAKEVKQIFFDAVPELPSLINRLKGELKRTGRISLCDGSKIIVSSPHMVIPYLLQGDESRIMKKAAINVHSLIVKRGLDILKVGDIHDEWQNDAYKPHAEEFAYDVCPIGFAAAGKYFDYNVPIECDAVIGNNWAETH